jgi:hypothetical protein
MYSLIPIEQNKLERIMNTIRFTYAPTDTASSGSFLSDNLHGETLISLPKGESIDFCLVSNRPLELHTEGASFLDSWLHFQPSAGDNEFHYTFSAKWSQSFLDSGHWAAVLTIEDPLDRESYQVLRFLVGDFDVQQTQERTVDLTYRLAGVSQAYIATTADYRDTFWASRHTADAAYVFAFADHIISDVVAKGGFDAAAYRELLNIGSHGESPRDQFNRFLTTT